MTKNSAANYEPVVPAATAMREFTARALVLGVLLGVIFGASSLYLVLKVGLTVSASIPVAIIAVTFFRLYAKFGGRDSTILENNIVQTAGSAGDSIAFGLGATMPAILILGFDLEIGRVLLVAVLGGLLGILMMIPLRRTLIVEHHGDLKYPEGTASAQVLIAAEETKSATTKADNRHALIIFGGFAIGLIYKTFNVALKGWKEVVGANFISPLKGGSIAAEISPELLGVGYIIGLRLAATMCAGGVMSYLLLMPLIAFFGESQTIPLAPAQKLIADMSVSEIRSAYILYIGAGAVATGGVISLIRALPTIWRSARNSVGGHQSSEQQLRTERDIPLRWVVLGSIAIIIAISFAKSLQMNMVGAALIVMCGFLFVTVSSRLAGEIGHSINPVSGMMIATLLLTCLAFLLLGWTTPAYYITALSVGAIVCVACANAGATSQDLKTGFLVGATPRLQQYAILCGALVSALCLGPILLKLNSAATVYVPIEQVAAGLHTDAELHETEQLQGPQAQNDSKRYYVWRKHEVNDAPAGKYLVNENGDAVYFVDPGINGIYTTRPDGSEVRKFDAPKAVLVSYLIKGILGSELPWALVLFGVVIAIVLEMVGVASLPFAVGVYLPLSTSAPILIGGLIRWWAERRQRRQYPELNAQERAAHSDRAPGVLLASGYIAGGALAGIVIAFCAGVLIDFDRVVTAWSTQINPLFGGAHADVLSLLPFIVLVAGLLWVDRKHSQP
jgi:putative OPT family oligopeptide transporter